MRYEQVMKDGVIHITLSEATQADVSSLMDTLLCTDRKLFLKFYVSYENDKYSVDIEVLSLASVDIIFDSLTRMETSTFSEIKEIQFPTCSSLTRNQLADLNSCIAKYCDWSSARINIEQVQNEVTISTSPVRISNAHLKYNVNLEYIDNGTSDSKFKVKQLLLKAGVI